MSCCVFNWVLGIDSDSDIDTRTIKKQKAKQRKMDSLKRVKETKKRKPNALERKKEKEIAKVMQRGTENRINKQRGKKSLQDKKLKKLEKKLKKIGKEIDEEQKKLEKDGGRDLNAEKEINEAEENTVSNEPQAMEVDKNKAKGNMLGLTPSPIKDLTQGQAPQWGDLREHQQGFRMPSKQEDYQILSPVYEGDSDYDSDRTVCYSPSRLESQPLPGHSSGHSSNERSKSSNDDSNDANLSDIELDNGEGSEEWLPGDDDNSSNESDGTEIYDMDLNIRNKLQKSKAKTNNNDKNKNLNNVSNNTSVAINTTKENEENRNNNLEDKVKSSFFVNEDKSHNNSSVTNLKDVAGLTISSDIETLHDNTKTRDENYEKSDIAKSSDDNNEKSDDKLIDTGVTKLKNANKYHSISSDAEILLNDMKTVKDHEYLPQSANNNTEKSEDAIKDHDPNTNAREEEKDKSPCHSDDELPEVKLGYDSDATELYSDTDMDLDSARFRRFFNYLNHSYEDLSSSDSEVSEIDQEALDEALVKLLGRPSPSTSKMPAKSEGSARGRKRKAPIFPPKPSKRARRNWGSEDDYGSDGSESLPDVGMMNEIYKVMQGTTSKRTDDKKSNKVKIPNALEDDEEEYGVAEVYDDYMPLKLKLGCQHPDPVVETASLASVEPTDISYKLGLPEDTISQGKLSALQLEAIVYSSQAHEQTLPDGSRAGFLIGDGAGVGKGRTVAGVIFENWLKGRKRAIWISISNDLKLDAERDLSDIGAPHIKVHLLKDFKYVKLSRMDTVSEGVMFMTYTALSSKGGRAAKDSCFRFRIDQLLDWCGEDFDGVIVLDECHKAKNLCPPGGKGKPTKTGLNVYKLQEKLPKARLVYASATGATEPKNMAYMVRLGLWGKGTAFDSFSDFIRVVEKGGVGAMEIVAMDMKLRGMYIARQLSFRGVSFHIEEVPLETSLMNVYNDSVELWVEAKQQFDMGFGISGADPKMKRFMWAQFWGAHQRFFKYLCIAAKVDRAVAIAQKAVADGKCVVIGLQSTGEARTLVQLGQQTEELTEFLSTAEGVFKNLVETQFPGVKERPKVAYAAAQLDRMQQAILTKIEQLGKRLPRNMLDDLVDKLGGAEKVAEMTGRKGRLVKTTEEGQQQVHYESRCDGDATLDTLNVLEKKRFMDGDKVVAVISEAASSGISLQSDRRVDNKRRRVHITLELPWSADRAIQQFGRTHRCNQVNAPEYIFLISDLAGERRFASIVAKRLESLGALTHGDRRATETRDLSQFNIDNKYGKEALLALLQAVRGGFQRVDVPTDYKDFLTEAREALENVGLIDPDDGAYAIVDQTCNMSKFLNRILGVPVKMQNCLFKYFIDNLTKVTEEAKKKGAFDQGIVDVKGARCVRTLCVLRQHATGLAPVQLHTVLVDRGMDWDSALRKYNAESGTFYVARQGHGHRRNILLYVGERGQIYRPGTGLQRAEPLADIERKYSKMSGANWLLQAETLWSRNHLEAKTVCSHAFFRACQPGCKWGLRERIYYVLAGSVLAVWDKLEFQRMQVVRVRTLNASRIVGTLIPALCVDDIEKSLKIDAVSVETKKY